MRSVCRGALPTPEVSISVYQCECELYIYMRHVFINMYYGIKWKVKTADKIVRIVSLVWFAQIKTVYFFCWSKRKNEKCVCMRKSWNSVVSWVCCEVIRRDVPFVRSKNLCCVRARGERSDHLLCVFTASYQKRSYCTMLNNYEDLIFQK